MSVGKVRITVSVDFVVYEKLKEDAEKTGVSMSHVVNVLLRRRYGFSYPLYEE